jgi:NAD(P)-dependent dehydrogenase (short-subunit alcohol dehydrogenase family)
VNTLIVGASRGIGFELARQYRAAGAAVTATARNAPGLERLREAGITPLALDVADAASAAALAWPIDGAGFDVVIIAAGIYGARTAGLEAPSQTEFDAVMHTNVLGAMRVLMQLEDSLAPGARVAVLSSRMGSIGLRADTSGWLYRASKAALNSVLKDASIALAGRAICVALHPGWVRTDMGGSQADLEVADSAAGIRRTLDRLQSQDNGGFFNFDGTPLAW